MADDALKVTDGSPLEVGERFGHHAGYIAGLVGGGDKAVQELENSVGFPGAGSTRQGDIARLFGRGIVYLPE